MWENPIVQLVFVMDYILGLENIKHKTGNSLIGQFHAQTNTQT